MLLTWRKLLAGTMEAQETARGAHVLKINGSNAGRFRYLSISKTEGRAAALLPIFRALRSLRFCLTVLVIHADHHRGCFHHRIRFFARLQPQLFDGAHGNGSTDFIAAANVQNHNGVHRPFFDFHDLAF